MPTSNKKLASQTEQEKTKQQKTIIDMDDRSLEQSKGRARGWWEGERGKGRGYMQHALPPVSACNNKNHAVERNFSPPDAHRMGGNSKNDNDRIMVDGPEEIKHPNRNESCPVCLSNWGTGRNETERCILEIWTSMAQDQSILIVICRNPVHPQGGFVSLSLANSCAGVEAIDPSCLSREPAQETRPQGGVPQINGIEGSTDEYPPIWKTKGWY